MIHLEPCKKEDYKFVYDLTFDFFKTNLNVTYVKMETFDEFVRRVFVPDDKNYIIKNRIGNKLGYVHIMTNGEIGYFIDSMYQRRGYGTQAVKKLMELNPRKKYFASINLKNKASLKVIEKLGFKPKGTVYEKIK